MEKQQKDTLLWLTFVGYGIGVLMPWTSIVSTFDFLASKVRISVNLTIDRWAHTNRLQFILLCFNCL
jgi:hypothetical protein